MPIQKGFFFYGMKVKLIGNFDAGFLFVLEACSGLEVRAIAHSGVS